MSQMGDTNEMALKMFFGYKLSETSSPHLLTFVAVEQYITYQEFFFIRYKS